MNAQCQAKNDDGVEKVATIFSSALANHSLNFKPNVENEEVRESIPRRYRANYAQKFPRVNSDETVRAS